MLTAALMMLVWGPASPAGAAAPAGDAYVLDLPGSQNAPIGGGGGTEAEAPLTDPGGIVGERSAPQATLGAGLQSLWQPGGLVVVLVLGAAVGLALRRGRLSGSSGKAGS